MASIDAATLFSVKGLVAVVTGGGSGIGLMMAQALSANGAKVYIVGRRLEHLEKAASTAARKGSIIPMQGDVTDKKSLESMAERVKKEEGLLNLLVCNSGISGPSIEKLVGEEKMTLDQVQEYLWDVPMEDFTKVFNVNATGVFYSMLAFMKLLDAGNRAEGTHTPSQVIATSSIGGFIRNEPGGIAYASSKAAVTHMMKTCSTVLSPYDIRFNVIAPGSQYQYHNLVTIHCLRDCSLSIRND